MRISDGDHVSEFVLEPLQSGWLWLSSSSPTGPIEIVDPQSCATLDRDSDIPSYHSLLVINEGDVIAIGEEGPGELPARADLEAPASPCSTTQIRSGGA